MVHGNTPEEVLQDAEGLNAVLDDSFVLIHMTGMRQDKRAFIRAVCYSD